MTKEFRWWRDVIPQSSLTSINLLLVCKIHMGYVTKVMMSSINIFCQRAISRVSFKFITCAQFEIPLYTPKSALGIMRTKLHEELITFRSLLHMQHPSCNQCCFFSVTFKIIYLFHNLLKFRGSELFADQVQTKFRFHFQFI